MLPTKEILRTSVFSTLIKWAHGLRKNNEKWDYILDYYLSEDLNYSTVLQGIKDEKNIIIYIGTDLIGNGDSRRYSACG